MTIASADDYEGDDDAHLRSSPSGKLTGSETPAASPSLSDGKVVTAQGNIDPTPSDDKVRIPVRYYEIIAGLSALAAWFVLFAGAILINTQDFRDAFTGVDKSPAATTRPSISSIMPKPHGTTVLNFVYCALVILAFWTVTNVGLLSCLAAFIGALGRRTQFAISASSLEPYSDALPAEIRLHYIAAVIRGFSIYTLVMAGLLVLATEAFVKTDPGGYLRLAGMVTVISFYVGYDPTLFAGLLGRVKQLMGGADKPDPKDKPDDKTKPK